MSKAWLAAACLMRTRPHLSLCSVRKNVPSGCGERHKERADGVHTVALRSGKTSDAHGKIRAEYGARVLRHRTCDLGADCAAARDERGVDIQQPGLGVVIIGEDAAGQISRTRPGTFVSISPSMPPVQLSAAAMVFCCRSRSSAAHVSIFGVSTP